MSRAKIWGYTLLALVAGGLTLFAVTQRIAEAATDQMGATLRAGIALFDSNTRLGMRQVSDVATLAARDAALVAAASLEDRRAGAARGARPPGPDVLAAGESALREAARLLDVDLGNASILAVASEGAVAFRIGDRVGTTREGAAEAVLGGSGSRHLRVEDALYLVATVPVSSSVTLAFGLPVDARWPERLRTATGADLTLLTSRPVSSLPPGELATVVNVARKGGGASVDGGRLGPVSLGAGLPGVPILFARAPSFRARAVSVPGLEGPVAVLSVPGRASHEPLAAFQQAMLVSLAVLLLVGVVLGLLPQRAVTAHVPLELAAAADRIAAGDFEVRVPRMSGTFGTVASALSRAADAARSARAQIAAAPLAAPPVPAAPPPTSRATPAHTLDVPMTAVPPVDEPLRPSGTPFPVPVPPPVARPVNDPFRSPVPPAPSPSPVYVAGTRNATASRLEPAPVTFTRPVPVAAPAPTPAAPPAPVRVPPPAPGAVEPDDVQWQAVFQEFLRTREECRESLEGLTWDRFRAKLIKNRDALTQKYACRTVRFQVYVKEGKAALKATPVR